MIIPYVVHEVILNKKTMYNIVCYSLNWTPGRVKLKTIYTCTCNWPCWEQGNVSEWMTCSSVYYCFLQRTKCSARFGLVENRHHHHLIRTYIVLPIKLLNTTHGIKYNQSIFKMMTGTSSGAGTAYYSGPIFTRYCLRDNGVWQRLVLHLSSMVKPL
jgi:hypothetical protein